MKSDYQAYKSQYAYQDITGEFPNMTFTEYFEQLNEHYGDCMHPDEPVFLPLDFYGA